MSPPFWYLTIGTLLITVVLASVHIRKMPLSPAMLYLGVGWLFGHFGLLVIDPARQVKWLEVASEVGVIVSLFSAGLKLRLPFNAPEWRLPVALASGSMALTIAMLTAFGLWVLKIPLGLAILFAAMLAPTDPVLASEVQVLKPGDRNRLRFTLTAEAGLNDGSAFPFILLGLGWLNLSSAEFAGPGWELLRDVLWGIVAGLGVGACFGSLVARLVVFVRRGSKEEIGADDFIAMGLIAASYGAALALHAYGFLAVFAAGLALRRVERELTGAEEPLDVKTAVEPAHDLATDPKNASGYLAAAVLEFNEQLERIAEIGLVLTAGALLATVGLSTAGVVVGLVLIFIIRPLATLGVSLLFRAPRNEALLISWFGIRGIGSLYYLFYATAHGLAEGHSRQLIEWVLAVIAVSVCLHGITATPLLTRYRRQVGEK